METTTKNNNIKYFVIGGVAVITLVSFIIFWLNGSSYETTDNAQLDGNIEPVRSSVTAYIAEIYFTDNQHVKTGDTLIRFNNELLLAKVKQAEAALENANASVLASDNKASASAENANASLLSSQNNQQNIISAKADLDKAQADVNRANELLKIKAITQENYESLQTKLKVAQANYTHAIGEQKSSASTSLGLKSSVKAEQNQTATARALVKQREAELVIAQQDLNHSIITAPFDGIVTKRSVQVGQYVASGQTLCSLVDSKNIWVSANFKETQLNKIRPGQAVEINIDAYPGMKLKGQVASFGGATGSKFSLLPPDNATGNFIKITQRFPLIISIDPASLASNQSAVLFAGLSAFVKVNTK